MKKKKRQDQIFKQNYWQFSKHVLKFIFNNKKFFTKLALMMIIISILMLGVLPQANYNGFRKVIDLQQTGTGLSVVFKKSYLMLASVFNTGGFAVGDNRVKNIYLIIILILTWLIIIRFLRFSMAKKEIDFKDIIYSCGGPIISLLVNLSLLCLKLIPLALIIILYSVMVKSVFFESAINSLILNFITLMAVAGNVYWLVPSLLSLVVVTLPNIYPFESIKLAKDLVVGQRFKVILRLIWHILWLITFWMIILLPMITLDNFLSSKISFFNHIPFVSLLMIVMTVLSSIWTFVYFYFIYRRLMENDQSVIKKYC